MKWLAWRSITEGEALSWPHRIWFAIIFFIGILYCFAFPPFQTNDEDAHWLHLWGVAYGNLRCGGDKPASAVSFLGIMHEKEVREDPSNFRQQFLRDAAKFRGFGSTTKAEGTACRYPPTAYFVPGLVARVVAFDLRGKERPGGMLHAAYAVRITNWILMSLSLLWLCRRLPWCRNFVLFFYSIPEAIQQGMAVNNDSFLVSMTALMLILVFTPRPAAWKLPLLGAIVGLMTMVKPVFLPFSALGLILWERLFAQHRWRWRDAAAIVSAVVIPWAIQSLWLRWLNAIYVPEAVVRADWGHTLASQQIVYLHEHPRIIFPLLVHQFRDFLFSTDLMRGSWISVLGAFGWSMFGLDHFWAYWLLVFAGTIAFAIDLIASEPSPGQPRPSWRGVAALLAAAGAVELSVIGVIVGMYVYFSGAFLGRIGADEVIGVQGRYYHTPILLWTAMLLHAVRRRQPLGRWTRSLPAVFVALAMFACVIANLEALDTILKSFYGHYLQQHAVAPTHY